MNDPLMRINRISVVHDGGVQAVEQVSLTIRAGETISLIGESGSGKTTLARAMLGLIRPAEGEILFGGKPVEAMGRAFRRSVQMIFQDPAASLSPRLRVRNLLAEPLRIHGLSVRERWPEVLELLDRVGLPRGILESYPHQLSGGQARRVAIARALTLRPRLVVADEPTAGLDVSVRGEVINLMSDLQRVYGLTWFVISHDLAAVGAISDRVAVMHRGRVVEQGAADTLLRVPSHPYTQTLLASVPRLRVQGA